MDYERIHKIQSGIISPSKLRMKLMGIQNQRKKEGSKSNSNSARTSPSKAEDVEFVNGLLATNSGDFYEEDSTFEVPLANLPSNAVLNSNQGNQNSSQPMPKDHLNPNRSKIQQYVKGDTGNSSSVHPMRTLDDDNLDYDSNSSFEFHKGERIHIPIARSLLRPMSSKWNDAEKWIINKQNTNNHLKRSNLHNQANGVPVRVVPEYASYSNKLTNKRLDKFSFTSSEPEPNSGEMNGENGVIDLCPQRMELKEMDGGDLSCTTSLAEDKTGIPSISVTMRDMGTEMTPIPSQEPSRTASPMGATTPFRSPTSSIPSTPRGGPTSTPVDYESQNPPENSKIEYSEQDLKSKTRKEIIALGVKLGKSNIAAWASKDENELADMAELNRVEFEKRAAAWEEVEKTKHNARFKREEIEIEAWESQQKAKLEAEKRRIEAQLEQMRARAQAKIVKKMAMAKQRLEEKRVAAEARKNSEVEKTVAQAEYIRQTGRIPSSPYMCCGWS